MLKFVVKRTLGWNLKVSEIVLLHTLPRDAYRIENLGTGQIRLNYTINQMWNEIDWNHPYSNFFEMFCELALTHYKRVKADAEARIASIFAFKHSGYAHFKFIR